MNEEILGKVLENKSLFVPGLFTERQIGLMEKYLHKEALNNTEKAYFYSTIKKKIAALSILKEEVYIQGEGMLPERVAEAKKILKELGEARAFISGSFLYKKDYRDIDIFVLAKKRESHYAKNQHFNFITKKLLQHPIYLSSLKYSVSTFSPEEIHPKWKRPSLEEVLMTYQLAINEILNKEEERTLRELLFMYHFYVGGVVLSSFALYQRSEELIKKAATEKITEINETMKKLVLKLYTKSYLYVYLGRFVKMLKKDYTSEPYANYPIFIKLFTEVKNECRRA